MEASREARYIEAIEAEEYRAAPDRAGAASIARAVMALADAERAEAARCYVVHAPEINAGYCETHKRPVDSGRTCEHA